MMEQKNWVTRVLEACIALAISAFLIHTAVSYIWCVKYQIMAIAGIIILAIVIYRILRYLHNSGRWRDDHDCRY